MGLDEFQSESDTTSTSPDLEQAKTSSRSFEDEKVDVPDAIAGNLLADAMIKTYDDHSASFIQITEDWDYLFYLKQQCPDIFLKSKIRVLEGNKYYLRSSENYDMYPIYKKWYKRGYKSLPRAYNINSDILKHWYMCSGEVADDEIHLYANWMNDLDSGIMSTILRSKIASARIERQRNDKTGETRFRFFHNADKGLFEYIGSCPIACYQSKWLTV
jgi:hypothetical protein